MFYATNEAWQDDSDGFSNLFINIFLLLLLFIVIPTVEIKFVEVVNQF